MLAPIFDEAADKVSDEFPASRVILGKVDCDKESKLPSLSKYLNILLVKISTLIVFVNSFNRYQVSHFQVPNS